MTAECQPDEPEASPGSPTRRYDVFLSRHSADKPAVERVARHLLARGLSPWLDAWALTAGGDWQAELADGLRACRACAVFVGPRDVGAWSRMEARLALDRAAKDPAFRVFAVLLPGLPAPFDPAMLPPFLAAYSWVDLRGGLEDEAGLEALARAIRGEARGAPAVAIGAAGTAPEPPAPPGNLPAALSSFVGREREHAEVLALLGRARLVTLTGAGGVGKTRLVLAVAEDVRDSYPDGVWLAELAPLAEPAPVAQAVAKALGVREEPGLPLLDALAGYFKAKRALLVLDKCEHLIAACAGLAEALLRAAPQLRILATSREGLGVPGEQAYRVPSLPVPDLDRLPPPEGLGGYAAVALFVARARERRADFALGGQNVRAVAEVCARLDGMPLAIELAAARVGSLPIEAIAARLHDRFRLLTGGPRTAVPRQQTLRAALDWSYDLLSESEKRLLDRLSVFVGGWTLAAAEAVCGGEGIEAWEVLDLLGGLVNKSLVLLDADADPPRYRLLETVRQYVRERLESRADAATVHERHAAFFLTQTEEAKLQLTEQEHPVWWARLESEQDNLRAARRWFLERGAADESLRLAIAHEKVWPVEYAFAEAMSDLEQALALPAAAPDRARAWALVLFGWGTMTQGNTSTGRRALEEGLMLGSRLEERPIMARALLGLGMLATFQGDYPRARALLEESLVLYRALSDWWGLTKALCDLGRVVCIQGDHALAHTLLDEALALARGTGQHQMVAFALEIHGEVAFAVGEYTAAGRLWEESLSHYNQLGISMGTVNVENFLGLLALRLGDYATACTRYRTSLEHQRGWLVWAIPSFAGLAAVAAAGGQAERALRLAGAASALGEAAALRLPEPEQEVLGGAIEAARAVLGERAATAALAGGRALTLVEAISLALEARPAP